MAGPQYVYHMQGLSKTYPGGKKVFENIHLSFLPDAKIGVVGVNGAGKSTLLRIMAGQDKEFNGEAWSADGVKVGYLPQEPKLDESKSVFENIAASCPEKQMLDKFNEISGKLGEDYSDELMEEMTALQEKIDAADAWDIDSKIQMAMEALRCPPDDADVSKLSGGEVRRVAICALLLSKPDMILMDEPTNHLDAETVAWLQNYLINFKGCVILVTHDRYFLDDITTWILELDRGRGIPYQGNYSDWLEQKAKRMEQEAREERGKQRSLAKELEWVRSSPKARQAKSKARIQSYEQKAAEAEKEKVSTAQIRIPPGPRLGNVVLEAENLRKGFGDNLLIEDLDFKLPPGGIVGVIGPNGAGKSTLFKMILGQEEPDAGSLRVGDTVKFGYVDQSRNKLDDSKNVWEEISGGTDVIDLGGIEVNSRAYVGAFNFKGADQQKNVGKLSGGERNRVHMAKMLKQGGNVLLLDEPTNYLDLEGAAWLESYIKKYPYTVLIVSHDRELLNRCVTHTMALEHRKLSITPGGYDDWLKLRAAKLAQLESQKAKQDKDRQHLQAFVDRFRAKASKARQAQSRIKMLEKMQDISIPVEDRTTPFHFAPPKDKLAPPMLELRNATLGYGEDAVILDKVNLRLDPDDRIAIVGANGQGKTTLVKSIGERLSLLGGERVVPKAVRIGYFSQDQLDELSEGDSVLLHVQRIMPPGTTPAKVRAAAAAMGFSHEKVETNVEKLSGGEKVRLLLGLMSSAAPHILILDEPTSHLDIDSREALIYALNDFPGAVLLITHDVYLAEATADRLWLVNNGRAAPYDGDLADYRALVMKADRDDTKGAKAAKPAKSATPKEISPEEKKRLSALKKTARDAEERLDK
ncbi:MAG TPA: energy-dependent translational throttle protein EttA, partial [Hyphomonas atlantica]|nr:energy-dependent translational throttle protein EttA [Hyphomonas atlantica]